ncbi:hypothetical protein FRB90_001918 [Tulasnella sp. 427]|nr:hypothetical protein FRB90_001918 [Tulasnella sp. 427]
MSSDDLDSLFGDDPQSDHEERGLALPSGPGKTIAAATANGECGGSRVGTFALSVSPLPVSEQSSPAAIASSSSPTLPSGPVAPSGNVSPTRIRQAPVIPSPSVPIPEQRVAMNAQESSTAATRFENSLPSRSVQHGKARLTTNRLMPNRALLPTGASADDAILVLDDDEETQRPKKRRKKVLPSYTASNSSPADTIRAVMQSLTTDLAVTTSLQTLLEHLKSPAESTVTKIRRLDSNGREIPEDEWRLLKTQDLVRKLSATLQKALRATPRGGLNAGLSHFDQRTSMHSYEGTPTGTAEMLQTVIQQWIQSKLVSQASNALSATPAPSTPSSLASLGPSSTLSAHSTLPNISADCSTGMDFAWQNYGVSGWGASQTVLTDPLPGLGILMPSDPSIAAGSGQFDFQELESLLDLLSPPQPSPPGLLQNNTAGPSIDLLINPSLPLWTELPSISSSFPWMAEPPVTSTAYHHPAIPPSSNDLGKELAPPLPHLDISSAAGPSSGPLGFSIPPSNGPPTLSLPAESNIATTQSDSLSNGDQAPMSLDPVPEAVDDPPSANVVDESGSAPPKTTKMADTLERARRHRRSLQAALDKAMTTMWELEIEHATLSRVLKGITERQALPSATR